MQAQEVAKPPKYREIVLAEDRHVGLREDPVGHVRAHALAYLLWFRYCNNYVVSTFCGYLWIVKMGKFRVG